MMNYKYKDKFRQMVSTHINRTSLMLLLLKGTFLDKNNSYLQKKYSRHQIDLYAFDTDIVRMQTKTEICQIQEIEFMKQAYFIQMI